jgi:hypothetical protein
MLQLADSHYSFDQGPMLSTFTDIFMDFFSTLRLYTSVDYAVNRKYFITRQLSVVIHVEKFVNGNIGHRA